MLMGCVCVAGCQPVPPRTDHGEIIQRNGGYKVLKKEAAEIFKTIDLTKTETVDPVHYTPQIRALKPQIVAAHEVEPPVLMIQTMGGFNHQGLLIVLDTSSTHRPTIGHNWVRTELAPGVFEFRE